VLRNTGGDERMGEVEEQGTDPADDYDPLGVDATGDGGGEHGGGAS